jgi:calcineurin-like phosphoesterase family protein
MSTRRGFNSLKHHDDTIIGNILGTVPKRVKLYVLGDVGHEENSISRLAAGIKAKHGANRLVLVPGNHDMKKAERYLLYFDEVHGPRSYRSWWISHFPIHPNELYKRKGNIHGHVHATGATGLLEFPYFNVNVDVNNYLPVEFEWIETWFSRHKASQALGIDAVQEKFDAVLERNGS